MPGATSRVNLRKRAGNLAKKGGKFCCYCLQFWLRFVYSLASFVIELPAATGPVPQEDSTATPPLAGPSSGPTTKTARVSKRHASQPGQPAQGKTSSCEGQGDEKSTEAAEAAGLSKERCLQREKTGETAASEAAGEAGQGAKLRCLSDRSKYWRARGLGAWLFRPFWSCRQGPAPNPSRCINQTGVDANLPASPLQVSPDSVGSASKGGLTLAYFQPRSKGPYLSPGFGRATIWHALLSPQCYHQRFHG